MSDIEAAQRAHHVEGQGQVLQLLRRRRGTGFETRPREHAVEHRHRIDHRNPVGFDLGGDRTQDRVIAEAAHLRQHRERARVGCERIRQARAADTARHRGFADARGLEDVDHALQFADFDPRDLVGEIGQRRVGLVQMRQRDHADPAPARRARDLEGKDSVAGD